MFDNLKNFKNKTAIIYKNKSLTYLQLDRITKKKIFKKNRLVLILADNNIETLLLYISTIRSNSCVYLVDINSDEDFLLKTLKLYNPEYVAVSKNKKFQNNSYKNYSDFKNYQIFKVKKETTYKIHKNLRILLSTSGTTGSQKLAKISNKNILSNTKSICKYLKLFNDCSITTLPIFYSFGLSIINSHLYSGSKIILSNDTILQKEFWNKIKVHKVTNFNCVPFFFEILKKIKFEKFELKSLKFITLAGGKLNIYDEKYFNDLLKSKKISFVKMYGSTEASPRISYLNPKFNSKKIGSIGKAIPGGKLFIINNKNVMIKKPNVNGEICYKGPNVFMGYANSMQDLSTDNTPNYLKTGDIGFFDKDNYFFITGRKKRFAKIFGLRLNLDDIENMIKDLNFNNAVISNDSKLIIFLKSEDKKKSVNQILDKIKLNNF